MSQVYVRFRHCADDHGLREHDVAVHVDRLIADGRQDGQADSEFHLQRLQRLVDPGCGKIRKKSAFDMVRLTALTGSSGPVPANRSGQQEVPERDAHLLRVDLRDKGIQKFQHLDL